MCQNAVNKVDSVFQYELFALFQPIISVIQGKIIGFEGLIRGSCPLTQEIITPLNLFNKAARNDELVELDRMCREKCLEGFQEIYKNNNSLYLFMNIDTAIIEETEGSNYIINQIQKYKIPPDNIVIEIIESKIDDVDALSRFVYRHKKEGFLIALDDVGYGFSNLERIIMVKPDIIKIDRS